MSIQSRISSAMVVIATAAAVCSAQSVTSAHSGTLHYFEGDVSIDGTPVQSQVGRFSEVKEKSVLSTARGRAEVLLTPGVFLRIGENSSIRMLDNRLVSTRVDILSGSAIIESDDPQMDVKDSTVVLLYKDYEIRMAKHGLVEITADPGQLKVFKGEALVNTAGSDLNRVTVKEGRLLPFSAALLTEKFDDRAGDDLFMWARDRSQNLSAANMASARSLSNSFSSGYGSGYPSGGSWNGGWYFNPYFSMFTYVPMNGTLWSPFGYGFFSPYTIYDYYSPTAYWYGGGGAATGNAGGRPIYGINSARTSKPAPLGQLLSGNTARVNATGSPLRTGRDIGVQASPSYTPGAASAANGGGSSSSAVSAARSSGSSGMSAAPAHGGGGGRR
jgi:hypothetical protein